MEPWFETHGFTVDSVYAFKTHLNGILTAFHMKYDEVIHVHAETALKPP